jgi:hypothetical protein
MAEGNMKRYSNYIGLLVLLVLTSLFSSPVGAKEDHAIWLGIVRTDGVLIPFAQFNGTAWVKAWPEADQFLDLKIQNWTQVPKAWLGQSTSFPKNWTFHPSKGGSKELKVGLPLSYDAHCGAGWGASTNFEKLPKVDYNPYPKAGIVLSSPVEVRPVTVMDLSLSAKYQTLVRQDFERREQAAVENVKPSPEAEFVSMHIPVKREERNKTGKYNLDIYALSSHLVYFEASRHYFAKADEEYPDGSFMSGWIVTDSSGRMSLQKNSFNFSDDSNPSADYEFFGTFTMNGQTYAVAQKIYYEAESYSILRLTDGGFVEELDKYGGGC